MTDTSTWLQFTKDELYTLQYHMLAGTNPEALALREKIQERLDTMNDPEIMARWASYRDAVATDDDLSVDADAVISEGNDGGAWVMSWTWITDGEADLCSECSGSLDDGEGYDGMCGDCADKAEAGEENADEE